MLRPIYLQKGDKVALVSPAGIVNPEVIEDGVRELRSWGLEPILGEHVLSRSGIFAGTDAERMADMQWAMDADNIRAVFCTRGGYGCMRISERLDYSRLQGNPKWLVGFSDVTVLHTKLTALGMESLHAPMPKSFSNNQPSVLERMRAFLFGELTPYKIPSHALNRTGLVEGELTGGNLTLIHCLNPVAHRVWHNSILFIEDVGEAYYSIDRMMLSLKQSGVLSDIRGLIVGQFSRMSGENFGKEIYEIVSEAVEEYSYPVCFDFPAGHVSDNNPLIMGATVELSVEDNFSELTFI